jgi:competence protein ComEC
MVLVALVYLAGLALGLSFPPPAPLALGLAALALAATAHRLWRARRIHGPLPGSGYALLVALAAIAAWQGGRLTRGDAAARASIDPWLGDRLVQVSGRVAGEPRVRERSIEIVLRRPRLTSMDASAPALDCAADVILYIASPAADAWRSGDAPLPLPGQPLRVWGSLQPLDTRNNPSTFNAEHYWRGRNIIARLATGDPGAIEVGDPPRGPRARLLLAMRTLRGAIVRRLETRLATDQVALARALLLGDAHLLDTGLRERFNDAGLAHLLAVSGLHTGFILLIALVLARLVGLGPRAGVAVGLVVLVFYAALTGFRPPVVRAATMGAFVLAGFALGRVSTTPAALATAAFVTLLYDPRNLLRVDWQLSYVCVASIALIAPTLYQLFVSARRDTLALDRRETPFPWWRRALNHWILAPLATVLAVQMGLIPLQIAYFRQLYVLNPLANLVAIPFAFASVLALVLLAAVPGLGWIAGHFAAAMLGLLTGTVSLFDSLHFGMLTRAPLPAWGLWLYYGILLGGAWLRTGRDPDLRPDRRQRAGLVVTLLALVAVLVWTPAPRALQGRLELTMLDVGQGDSLAVRFPNGQVMVVDAGPPDAGQRTVGPFLERLGVRRIDTLVATHADADHIGGLPWLLEHFEIGLLIESPDSSPSRIFQDLESIERARDVPTHQAAWNESLAGVEPARARLLGPVPGLDDNNASVVLWITYGEVDLLLTGDLEAPGERSLIEAGLAPDVEILKVGHHGSRTSSSDEFIARVRPEVALISVGARNAYGHPSPIVLDRLAARGAQILRTDQLGALRIRTDGRTIQIDRYAGN